MNLSKMRTYIKKEYLLGFIILFFLALISACGQGPSEEPRTGSVSFSLVFPDEADLNSDPQSQQISRAVTLPVGCDTEDQSMQCWCGSKNIKWISAQVYNTYKVLLTEGGPWICEVGHGVVDGIIEGKNRSVVVLGVDADGNIRYRGESLPLTIEGGETADAGQISMSQFSIDNDDIVFPSDDSIVTVNAFALQWNAMEGAEGYRVRVISGTTLDDTISAGNISDKIVYSNSTRINGLSVSSHYSWQVYPLDKYNNTGKGSPVLQFSTDTVANQSPVVSITKPIDNKSYQWGEYLTFNGTVTDAEDANISGDSIVWISDLNGEFGTGSAFATNKLSLGNHTITLAAIDSGGAVGSTTIYISILSSVVKEFKIPTYTMTIDGNIDDWQGQPVALEDNTEETVQDYLDIKQAFIAQDTDYFYFRIDMIMTMENILKQLNSEDNSQWIEVENEPDEVDTIPHYDFGIVCQYRENTVDKDRYFVLQFFKGGDIWVYVMRPREDGSIYRYKILNPTDPSASDLVAYGGNSIEFRIPKSEIDVGGTGLLNGYWCRAQSRNEVAKKFDLTDTIQLNMGGGCPYCN